MCTFLGVRNQFAHFKQSWGLRRWELELHSEAKDKEVLGKAGLPFLDTQCVGKGGASSKGSPVGTPLSSSACLGSLEGPARDSGRSSTSSGFDSAKSRLGTQGPESLQVPPAYVT